MNSRKLQQQNASGQVNGLARAINTPRLYTQYIKQLKVRGSEII